MSNPWMKFYPSDWRADPALQMCSLAARGLWMEMLCIMHEAEPYGSLKVNGKALTTAQLDRLTGGLTPGLGGGSALIAELEDAGVFSRDPDGTIFSRRMRTDVAKALQDKENGRKGGNPIFRKEVNGGVNPRVKAQKPDIVSKKVSKKEEDSLSKDRALLTDFQNPEVDPQAELFRRGKDILGKSAGGMIAKLLKSKSGMIPHARAAIEVASTKENPKEYIGRVIKGGNGKDPAPGQTRYAV